MKYLREAKFQLGIERRKQPNGDVFLVWEKHAQDVVTRFNMDGCKTVSTLLELGCQLDSSQESQSQRRNKLRWKMCRIGML